MGPKSKKIIYNSWLLAVLAMMGFSSFEALNVIWAVSRHNPLPRHAQNLIEPALTEFKRQEQKYFLRYGVYVPLEDMMFVDQLPQSGARYAEALSRTCSGLRPGAGFAIWLPLKFKWPIIGERVIEWCWKPAIET